jgi:aryl-alcohol dehydrogenase-like predicted oxidoreductase
MPCWLNYPRAICKYTRIPKSVKPLQNYFYGSCESLCKTKSGDSGSWRVAHPYGFCKGGSCSPPAEGPSARTKPPTRHPPHEAESHVRLLALEALGYAHPRLYSFGEDWGWGTPKDEARKVYDAFREAGGNFIDTANIYTNGTSETLLGEFLHGHRQSVVLATKYSNSFPGTDPNAAGNHRKNMVQAVEASLKRLKTDYIDLYWLHIWDQITPVEEVMRAFDDLVRQGKVLYIGVSDAPAWWIAQANTLAQLRGWSSFVGLQIEHSLIERTVERELIPMAKALNIGVTAWSPLAGGVLTGKYHGHGSSEAGRMNTDMAKDFKPEQQRADRVVAAVKQVADETGRSLAQVALAWLQHRPVPVIPIIGARKLTQLQDNLASLEVALSPDQVKTLDEASQIEPGFPYSLYTKELPRAIAYGGLRDKILA